MTIGMGSQLRGPTGATRQPTGQKRVGGYDIQRLQNFTPEQMQLHQSLFSHVGPESYTSRLAAGDQSLFDEMEAPALRQFSGLQGNLASRFSAGGGGAGAMSNRRSGAFKRTGSAAASDFAQELQSRRQGLQRQAIKDLMGMSTDLLNQRPYEQFLQEPKKPIWQQLIGGALPIAGAVGGGYLGSLYGDPIGGATIGGKVGRSASEGFFA